MIYLHYSELSSNLCRHWANEISDNDKDLDGYFIPTYRIRQIETNIIYDEGIDTLPCQYNYEIINEKIIYNDVN